jgi:hypothetical protein
VLGKDYRACSIVWALSKGAFPEGVLRYIDGDPMNFNIENLRDSGLNLQLTSELAHTFLDYSIVTGRLYWRIARTGGVVAGAEAGGVHSQGYRIVSLLGEDYPAHRLIWLMLVGCFPAETIDHINGNRLDNSFINLREASQAENTRNRKTPITNTSGFKGVSFNQGRWLASGAFNGVRKTIGRYATPVESKNARDAWAKLHHKDFFKA